jgi:hypothetical protein
MEKIMAKKATVRALKKHADVLFSEYIRRKAANHSGMACCCSCLKWYHISNMDAGHYVSRRNNSLRYDERNVHPQCRRCNRFQEGNKAGYTLYLQKKYGPNIIADLNQEQFVVKRFKVHELQALIKDLNAKLKELRERGNGG